MVIHFGSRGPGRSSGIPHRNQLTAKAWEKAVQDLGKQTPTIGIKGLAKSQESKMTNFFQCIAEIIAAMVVKTIESLSAKNFMFDNLVVWIHASARHIHS